MTEMSETEWDLKFIILMNFKILLAYLRHEIQQLMTLNNETKQNHKEKHVKRGMATNVANAEDQTVNGYLLLLLSGQLHLLPLFLHLRSGEFLLLVMSSQKLLPQADQLGDHRGELVLLF